MEAQKIGKFISEVRKKKNMTQADLGKALCVTDKAVSKWECGKSLPDSSLFEELSNVLEVSINELVKGEYIEKEDKEKMNKESILTLISEIQKIKRNNSLLGALCALVISFITLIYSQIFIPRESVIEQFISGMVVGISIASLILGLLLIFKVWVDYSVKNSNEKNRH